ncbi:hypothetical protein Athai_37640 [Actinocatenispora thailandica]|uniref:Lipoprotein n=2 Tax=Actinocatenispora thailandica TaxID=227318 RepID=A0A7R7HY63_9ACTN|nr:hypothetical protein Athai_37640 [Actinocatenispora thailandica]
MCIAAAGLAVAALAVTGCGANGTPRAAHGGSGSPRAGSSGPAPDAIRRFDFGSAAWHHPMLNTMLRARTQHGDRTLTLHDGRGTGSTADGGPVSCRGAGAPVYGDIGGGAQVAAAGLVCSAGVNDYTAYYVWRWDAAHHTAVQDDQPLVVGEHCGSEVRTVAYRDHAFRITVGLGRLDSSCAESDHDRTPYSYSVVQRDGFLMRSAPEKGAVRECALNDGDMHQLKGVTLYADRDASSPVVYRPKGLATLWTVGAHDYYESTDDLTGKTTRWQFVRANLPHGYLCGYRQVS